MVERYAHVAPDGLQLAAVRLDCVMGAFRLTNPADAEFVNDFETPRDTNLVWMGVFLW